MDLKLNFSSSTVEAHTERLSAGEQESCSDFHRLIFIGSGEGELAVEGGSSNVKPGDVILTRPMAYCRFSTREALEYTSVSFLLDEVIKEGDPLFGKLSLSGFAKVYSAEEIAEPLSLALSTLACADSFAEEYKREYAHSVLRQALIILLSRFGENIQGNEDSLGARICEYVNENITSELSLEKIARAFFISKFYLCRAFKSYVGSSIHGYVVQKRIGLAKRLIDSGESASSVAYKVGFGDYSAFYRAYVKHVGKAPTQT